jgi:hypothetical protein
MNPIRRLFPRTRTGIAALLCLAGCSDTSTTGLEALDYAFRFASAIRSDAQDRGKAQERVIHDFAAAGALDEALQRVDQVEGWRRGTAYAELAVAAAQHGRTHDAAELIARAEQLSNEVRDWSGPRIRAHLARAYAALGRTNESAQIGAALPEEEASKARVSAIVAPAQPGGLTEALRQLQALEGAGNFDLNLQLVDGYLALAGRAAGDAPACRQALDGARRVAQTLPVLKAIEVQRAVAELYHGLRDTGLASRVLEEAETMILPAAMDAYVTVPALAQLATAWGWLGEKTRARRLLTRAVELLPAVQDIERPAMYAEIAAARIALGDADEGWRHYDEALRAAKTLANARPRALAVVEVCRSIGLRKLELTDRHRQELASLLEGLQAPW